MFADHFAEHVTLTRQQRNPEMTLYMSMIPRAEFRRSYC